MSDTPKKPTIDERLAALRTNLELFSRAQKADHARMLELDARERKGRAALLAGVAAYLKALNGEEA